MFRRLPLLYTAKYRHKAIIKLLAERDNIDADLKNKNGWSLLSCTIIHKNKAIKKLLAERDDVNVSLKDKDGQSPLSYTTENKAIRELLIRVAVRSDNLPKSGRESRSKRSESLRE